MHSISTGHFIYDLLIAHTNKIHPASLEGTKPSFRIMNILFPPIPNPPWKYWKLWYIFPSTHISPLLSSIQSPLHLQSTPRASPAFFKHRNHLNLFHLIGNDLVTHRLLPKPRSRFSALYEAVPYCCPYSLKQINFFPVDVHFSQRGILIVGEWFQFSSPQMLTNFQKPLSTVFTNSRPSLQQTCGTIHLPPDNGD